MPNSEMMPIEVIILTDTSDIKGTVYVSKNTPANRQITELLNNNERRFFESFFFRIHNNSKSFDFFRKIMFFQFCSNLMCDIKDFFGCNFIFFFGVVVLIKFHDNWIRIDLTRTLYTGWLEKSSQFLKKEKYIFIRPGTKN